MKKEVFYEMHVQGATKLCPFVPLEHRGKFSGIPYLIGHMKSLGVTVVQLMPVFNSEGTYWGYDPISWFELNPKYGTLEDFNSMVKALHESGLKVILDVVYNHVSNGARKSFEKEGVSFYKWDVTGCGNTVDVKSSLPVVMKSIHYWLREVGVDGMRFDLANVLGREGGEFNPDAQFFKELYAYKDKILVAEPWDCMSYSLGRFPKWMRELNDQARETLRNGRTYWCDGDIEWERSVNFITCHDGVTLADLIKYDHRFDWRDYEATKKRLMNNLYKSSHSVMLLAGDEFGNSQNGRDNVYLLGNEESWLNWDKYKRR